MRPLLLVFLVLFIMETGCAEVLVGGKYGLRFERDSESANLVNRNPYGLLGGYRAGEYAYTLEYATFTQETGNSTLSIARKQNLFLGGIRLHPFDPEDVFSWYPYFAAYLGGYYEKVTTTLLGQSDVRDSKFMPVFGVGAGVFGKITSVFRIGPEVRVLVSRDFDPQSVLDFGLTLGAQF